MLVFQKKQGSGAGLSIVGATFQTQHDLGSTNGRMHGFAFKPDGTKMYTLDGISHSIKQWTLSTPWDLSTLSYDSVQESVTSQFDDEMGISVSATGEWVYVSGRDSGNDKIAGYEMSTNWDLSTASWQVATSAGATSYPSSMEFKSDGSRMMITDRLGGLIHNGLNFPDVWWLGSSNGLTGTFDGIGNDTQTARYSSDGTKLFVGVSDTDTIDQYTLSTPYDVTTAVSDSVSIDLTAQGIFVIGDMRFSADESTLYVCRDGQQYIWEYSL